MNGRGAPLCIVVFVAFAVCLPAIRNSFVDLDDVTYVEKKPISDGLTANGIVFAASSLSPYWHPLTWLSHELDAELFGASPGGHHLTSVILHGLTAALLCLVLIQLGATTWQAAAGALLWALHPLRVESFAWVAERKDVLCALFFVAAIAAYLDYQERPSPSRYAAWLCGGALALMSKPTAVTLPLVLLLLDVWPTRRKARFSRLIIEKMPLVALTAVVSVLTVIGQQRDGATRLISNLAWGTRFSNAVVACSLYLGKMAWPLNLACHYPYRRELPPIWVMLSGALLIGITVVAITQWKNRPWIAVGWAWFIIILLPNAGLIQAGRQAMADRFTHIPMIGLVIGAVWTISDWIGPSVARRKATFWAAMLVLAACAALTIRQIGFWRDSETLFRHAIAVTDSAYMRANLGTTLIEQGRYSEAEPQMQAAVRLDPSEPGYHQDLALILSHAGRLDEAARESSAAVALAPHDGMLVEFGGLLALRRGHYEEALSMIGKSVNYGSEPTHLAAVLNDNGASLASRGRPQEGEPLVREALQLDATLVQARRNLVLILLDEGRKDDARASLRSAVEATGHRPEYDDLDRQLGGPTRTQ
jgi:Flp pilus assembly protein TadD